MRSGHVDGAHPMLHVLIELPLISLRITCIQGQKYPPTMALRVTEVSFVDIAVAEPENALSMHLAPQYLPLIHAAALAAEAPFMHLPIHKEAFKCFPIIEYIRAVPVFDAILDIAAVPASE
jgi:hypothetical protein